MGNKPTVDLKRQQTHLSDVTSQHSNSPINDESRPTTSMTRPQTSQSRAGTSRAHSVENDDDEEMDKTHMDTLSEGTEKRLLLELEPEIVSFTRQAYFLGGCISLIVLFSIGIRGTIFLFVK